MVEEEKSTPNLRARITFRFGIARRVLETICIMLSASLSSIDDGIAADIHVFSGYRATKSYEYMNHASSEKRAAAAPTLPFIASLNRS